MQLYRGLGERSTPNAVFGHRDAYAPHRRRQLAKPKPRTAQLADTLKVLRGLILRRGRLHRDATYSVRVSLVATVIVGAVGVRTPSSTMPPSSANRYPITIKSKSPESLVWCR